MGIGTIAAVVIDLEAAASRAVDEGGAFGVGLQWGAENRGGAAAAELGHIGLRNARCRQIAAAHLRSDLIQHMQLHPLEHGSIDVAQFKRQCPFGKLLRHGGRGERFVGHACKFLGDGARRAIRRARRIS
ncbi:hypothetical protein D3C86_1423250 [compost metagenome]